MENQAEWKRIKWTIPNFSSWKANFPSYSGIFFTFCYCDWEVAIFRGQQDGEFLSIFLQVVGASTLPQGWSVYAHLTFTLINQISEEKSYAKDRTHMFCANKPKSGYESFIPLTKLQDPSSGCVLNDNCTIEVEFFVIQGNNLTSLPANAMANDVVNIDFKDLGPIEKTLVPLLENVCSWHPLLMDCKKKRSREFTGWAFTALGRVLHFLNNKKWGDMNEEACEQLQALWEEVEMSRLDLSWLEPRVRSALNMKGYLVKAKKLKKLDEELAVLNMELKIMKEDLASKEQAIELARKKYIKTQEALDEEEDLDLDAKIWQFVGF